MRSVVAHGPSPFCARWSRTGGAASHHWSHLLLQPHRVTVPTGARSVASPTVTRFLLCIAPVVIAVQLVVAITPPGTAGARTEAGDLAAYVVHARTTADATSAAAELGVRPTRRFDRAFAGFAARLSRDQVDRLRARSGVLGVEEDRPIAPLDANRRQDLSEGPQPEPSNWGLDRIDQRGLPLDRIYTTTAT